MTSLRHYELSDFEWSIIEPLLPNKPRGVPRADDRKVLNGIYWRLRTGAPWAEIPERYGPATTCYNRIVRGRKLGVWDRIFEAVSAAYDGDLQMGTVPRCGCASTRPTSKVPAIELCGPAAWIAGRGPSQPVLRKPAAIPLIVRWMLSRRRSSTSPWR